QLLRAEALLGEIELEKSYPYQYVAFRITEYRPDVYPDLMLKGGDLSHDLHGFIEDVSGAANLAPTEVGEPVLTVEEVSKRFNISTKTVNRWRQRGLVSRRFLVGGRKRVGFLQSSVDRFVDQHPSEVERGSRFSQLTDEEKVLIVRLGRRLAAVPSASLAKISRRIGRRLHRSPETIRYTIKNHDREHPDQAIFVNQRGPLNDDAKNKIYNGFRRGISIDALAEKYGRTRSSIYRIVNEVRAERILALPVEYIHHPSFDDEAVEAEILQETPIVGATGPSRAPSGLPPYLQSLYEVPLLSREEEFHLFRRMNFLLCKAKLLRDGLDPAHARSNVLDEIETFQEKAQEVKQQIIRSNLRLVVSIAKRHVSTTTSLFELISDGNVSLMRAVEKFDFGRGFKFSTYASWAIMKNFART
ncbi:MAG: sigma factor, partial [Planctomycetia bacterium]